MELPVFTSFRSWSRLASCPCSYNFTVVFNKCSFHRRNFSVGWNFGGPKRHLRIAATSAKNSPSNRFREAESEVNCGDFWRDSEFLEVIGIGSRKDAVLNFCLESPFQSSSLRYWNIVSKDSQKLQLQQRVLGKDPNPRTFEAQLSLTSASKTIILVASAGYGMDYIPAINILKTIRSANGFTVAIILKPFSFEGHRRRDEVKDLMEKLKEHTNLFIDLDTDKLLKKDLVTLDEAVKTANNAVVMAVTAVSVLKSDMHRRLTGASCNDVKDIEISEVFHILESYKEAKIGFGAGYNMKTSILQTMYDCPFLDVAVKDLDGIIICTLASSDVIKKGDLDVFLRTFRQTTEYRKEILLATIHEPSLEPNLLVTTVLVVGSTGQQVSQKSSILTRLAQHFPFIFRFFRRSHLQSSETKESSVLEGGLTTEVIRNTNDVDVIAEGSDKYSEKFQMILNNYNEFHDSSEFESSEAEFFDAATDSSSFHNPSTEETSAFQREELVGWNLGLGYQIAQEWAKERAAEAEATSTLDKLSIFCLPVGVRPSQELKDRINISSSTQLPTLKTKDVVELKSSVNLSTRSWNELTDTGLEAVRDFYNTASALLKGNSNESPKREGLLSARAASMLEAERDSPKQWSPIVEMKYRGGIYKGRCQGGLPKGKGRLVLGDGSIYDGMWRYGKKSGLGTFYFSNGDVFQGSWRDDVMHGKGWFYFHTGDRWFANFWKGKANGEGRFYSKSGDIFFGYFQNGWRHGEFICIDVDGRRCVENWDEGILVSRSPLDS
ncbi:protein ACCUMULATION AND REPLICATION OF CHLOROPLASTS 3 [Morus notabilis]|uniref:protein ACCUMULATION AND REPLICATION OF CHLOROPLASTS 3 n=1 Tax=Morus notabilis TaxID=981085 RepID=UPI000CED4D79|nr:protein ACCUMULATION AND REPLICATION OF CHLOROPLASTS 3 [Morus notabilis]